MNVNSNSGGPLDVEGMLDTCTANPDTTDFAVPPDGVRGASTLAKQKIATDINWNKAGAAGPFDVWIVQWDHESTVAGDTTAVWMCSQTAEDATGYFPGNLVAANSISSWDSSGYSNTLITGGLCIYYMPQGKSPFPSDVALVGPWPPQFVDQLLYGDDMLHDNVRVLGSNYELVDTTNSLNQQGNCYQGAWDANQHDCSMYSQVTFVAGTPGVLSFQQASLRNAQCPAGSTQDLIKQPSNRMAAAKLGTFVMNRLDMSDNEPSNSTGNNTIYESITSHPLLGGARLYLVATTTTTLLPTTSGSITVSTNQTQSCRCWMTGVQMNVTVFNSLNLTYAATISRELIVQAFIRPGSKYAAFAKMNHGRRDTAILDRLQNVMDELVMFQPSDSNRNGKFAKAAKSLWKKAVPIVKGAIGVANVVAPKATKKAMAAANAATGGAAGEVVAGAKEAKKLKKKIKKELKNQEFSTAKKKLGPQMPQKMKEKLREKAGDEELAAIMERLYSQ